MLCHRCCQQRLLADEIPLAFQVDCPAQPRFQRVGGFIHVLTVKIHAGFESQRVTCAESCGRHSCSMQCIPEICGVSGGQYDFETILTSVAGSGNKILIKRGRLEQLQVFCHRLGAGNDLPNLGAGIGPLHCNHGQITAWGNFQARGKLIAPCLHPRHILVSSARIYHHAEPRFGQEINNQIVNYPALRIEHAGIKCLTGLCQFVHIVGK